MQARNPEALSSIPAPTATMSHEIFAGVYFCGMRFFVLQELIFVIRTDRFILLGINFCDFQKVTSTQNNIIDNIFVFNC